MKISVEFDTQTKLLTAKSDGTAIDNLSSIVFYCGKDDENNTAGMVEITTHEYDKEQKVYKMTRVSAKETDQLILKEKTLQEEIAEVITSTIFNKNK